MSASGDYPHQESWLLLPWLANGRLDPLQRLRVEQHVRGCSRCAREVELQRLICRTLTEPERVTHAPGPSLRKLLLRIDARPAPSRPAHARASAWRPAWRPPGLAWAATFVLAVGLLTTLATTVYRWSQPLYVTHTDAAPASPAVLHVAFDRSLTLGEVHEVLQSAGGRVVEGPDSTGIFSVAPVAAPTAAVRADAASRLRSLAERLRADVRVRWVEPLAHDRALERGEPRSSR
ncbi:MAG: zf-HC2 domain-containing protein, partial [Steroidobacteraceae bacterium]